ncbi:MAG: exonuclease SbcCD subunit D [Clostridia bacterium]
MKFVHIADMHFDTPFTTLNSKGDFGKLRRLEQREIFSKIINYIKENKIHYLFIAGDLYEHNYIRKSTIEYINELFKTIPETKIFITPGNHDPYIKNSMYYNFNWNENVKIFTSKIEKVETEEADIYGVGFSDFYFNNSNIENIIIENKNKINILITHGTLDASNKEELQYNPIKKNNLKKLGFDYIALGHIHKTDYNSEENQNIVYPGSTISMGFDELGKHGFIVGNIEKNKLDIDFIPIDNREFKELEFDITQIKSQEELIEKLNNIYLEENNLYKIILIGKRNFEIEKLIINKENIIKIKNKTKLNYNLENMANENTLKGIFAKQILDELKQNNYTQEELEQILEIGFSVLDG